MIQLLSVARTAEVLDCSKTHVYRLISSGALRSVETKAGGTRPKTRVRSDDLEKWIEQQTSTAPHVDSGGGVDTEVRRDDGT